MQEQLIKIEIAIANLEKQFDDLNSVVLKQNKEIELLKKQNQTLLKELNTNQIKPLNEETPPPHY